MIGDSGLKSNAAKDPHLSLLERPAIKSPTFLTLTSAATKPVIMFFIIIKFGKPSLEVNKNPKSRLMIGKANGT